MVLSAGMSCCAKSFPGKHRKTEITTIKMANDFGKFNWIVLMVWVFIKDS
jgi:hypothetical protein